MSNVRRKNQLESSELSQKTRTVDVRWPNSRYVVSGMFRRIVNEDPGVIQPMSVTEFAGFISELGHYGRHNDVFSQGRPTIEFHLAISAFDTVDDEDFGRIIDVQSTVADISKPIVERLKLVGLDKENGKWLQALQSLLDNYGRHGVTMEVKVSFGGELEILSISF